MIKNKFLRYLATLLSSILVIVIVSLIDKAPGSPLTSAMLFMLLLWSTFFFWRGVIGFPKNKPLQMIKKLFMLILMLLALLGFVIGIVIFYEEEAPKLAGATLIATLVTYVLAIFSAKDEDHFGFKYAPFVPPAIALVSALFGFLLSFTRPYSAIAMIVIGASLIVATVYGFKKDYIGFNLTGPVKYSYKPSTGTQKTAYESPQDAMKSVCGKCEQTRQLSNLAKFFPKITCSFENGCVVFTVSGNVMTLHANVNRAVLDDVLKIQLKKIADELEVHYQLAIERLSRRGTSTSSVATAKVMRGNITIT